MLRTFFLLAVLCAIASSSVHARVTRPLNIAHRGSSGMLPEHTKEGYELAISQGADVIECDICVTKDLKFVCLHESLLDETTNVKDMPEFEDRKRTYEVEGKNVTGFFSVDFTLAEIQTINKVQHFEMRDQNYNGIFPVASLEEHIKIAQSAPRTIGIYPEIKSPHWVNSLDIMRGQRVEDLVVEFLHEHGYTSPSDPCFVQCFDFESVEYLSTITDLRLVQLIEADVSDEVLDKWTKYVYGVGPWKDQIVKTWTPENGYKNYASEPTDFLERLHSRGFKVHPYTFRAENKYLAHDFGQDIHAEFELFVELGVDGMFTDHPASLTRYYNSRFGEGAIPDGLEPSHC